MSAHSISVEWSGQGEHFIGHNPTGPTVSIDGNRQLGSSPMMLLLHAEAGCTGIDVLSLLEKMRQLVTGLKIEVDAVKRDDDYPRIWEKIHLRYIIRGKVDAENARKAVNLSLGKYCSVSAMLGKAAEITSEVVLVD